MEWYPALDIQKIITRIVKSLSMDYIDCHRIVCFRSQGSTSRARARIWSLPRVWQQALNLKAHYIIEVIDRHFDKLSEDDKQKVLIHELLHIPKNFSGALVPHKTRYWRLESLVDKLFRDFKSKDDYHSAR